VRLHRTDRQVERLRQILVLHALEIVRGDEQPLVRRQARNRLLEPFAQLEIRKLSIGRTWYHRLLPIVVERRWRGPPRLLMGADVRDDAVDPGGQPRLAAKVREPAVDAQEDVLRKILSAVPIGHTARDQREHQPFVTLDELLKCLSVTSTTGIDQLVVGHCAVPGRGRRAPFTETLEHGAPRNVSRHDRETSAPAAQSNQFRQWFLEGDVEDFVWISPLWIPIVAIIGGITLAIVKSISWARVRELEVRERIAMIEKGLIPPPETDPRGFDRAMGAAAFMEHRDRFEDRWSSRAPERHRRAGVMLIGVGFGLMLMLGMLAEGSVGLGVGGFLVLLGFAFFINGVFERRDRLRFPPAGQPPSPAPPQSPPQSAGADLNTPRS
jgi:hypothetical protein